MTGQSAHDTILVLDYGGQTARLIARRVRECHVYSELIPWNTPWERIQAANPKGIILSGSPYSVYEPNAPALPAELLGSGLPVLGICYGLQLLAHNLGGRVAGATRREYGPAILVQDAPSPLFAGLPRQLRVWMSHGDAVADLPPGFRVLAHSDNSPYAALGKDGRLFAIQFHPEVVHTQEGRRLIENFVFSVCGCQADWTPASFIEESVERVREQVGDGRVVCGLSGGVDSAVAAALIDQAIGERLTCVFVDNGLLRQGEAEEVVAVFGQRLRGEFRHVRAADRFLGWLAGVEDPEAKRKVIGEQFVRVFEEEAARIGNVEFLAQGTLYPDVIESTSHDTTSAAQRIKTHHNVGGLPERMGLRLVEPLRYLFKDEVREVGAALGLPERMVWRQPFPGPGLAVRIIGEVTEERLATLRAADAIVRDEIEAAGLARALWQSFAILTPLRSVGVMGDGRTYAHVVAIRAVTSDDAMTADWARLPHEVLERMASRIVNEVSGVNRVVYDITSKPPATIEWE